MSSRFKNFVCVVFVTATIQTRGQGTFQNLDFESGVFIPAPTPQNPFAVQWMPAMPSWIGFLGQNQQSVISYNALSLSVPNIAVMGPSSPADTHHGPYYIQLQNAFPVATDVPAIAQAGTLPFDSLSVRFLSAAPFAIGLTVTFSGNSIPLRLIGSTANNKQIWGGDISAFAGQTGELRFRGSGTLDYIQFSNQPIPEPSALCLIGLGTLVLTRHIRLPKKDRQLTCSRTVSSRE